jgi:hypothetical protein
MPTKVFKLDATFSKALDFAVKHPNTHAPLQWTEEMDFYIKSCYTKLGPVKFLRLFRNKFHKGSDNSIRHRWLKLKAGDA